MKRIQLLLLAVLLCGTAQADDFYLYLVGTDGTKTATAVADIEKITFADGQVQVTTTSGTATTLDFSDLASMYFNTDTAEGVKGLQTDAIDLSQATCFDLAGRQLSHLQPGVNIVRTADGQTLKIFKK